MRLQLIRQGLSLCVLLLVPALVCGQDAPRRLNRELCRIAPAQIDAKAAGEKAIEMFDTDKDGKLSGKELDKCPGLKAAIDKIDPSGKGEITAEMIAARIEAWQRSRLARMSLSCKVLHKGQPLAGAEVKFVPEKFLGLDDDKWIATGKTDRQRPGDAQRSDQRRTERSARSSPGFYRVEITKPGENIPAMYNADTIFGQEVAIDAKGVAEGIR